jgi:hypothetical protein
MKTVEELLALAEKTIAEREVQKVVAKETTPVHKFMVEFPIRPGLVKVPTYVLYYTYRVKFKGNPKITRHMFFLEFKKLFKQVRHGTQRFYLLDADNLDMTREGLLEAKYYDERHSHGRTKVKRKETQIKGLPTESGV